MPSPRDAARPPDIDRLEQLADFKRALDHAAIVATTDVAGRITYVNEKFCEISEYSRDELLGQNHSIVNSGYHPREFFHEMWRTIAGGRVWHGEIRNRAKSGRFYWVDTTIVPFLDEGGRPYQYIAIRADITARKAVEQQLMQQAALARVGQMAAIVAHEVRNPLAGIKGAIQVLASRRDPGHPELPIMQDIVGRIDALGELINDLMLFARPRPPQLAAANARTLVEDAVQLARRDPTAKTAEILVEGEASLDVVADAELVRAAVFNLLLNAVQATGGAGRIRVRLSSDGSFAILEVHDNGPGIPPELQERIFEPFFTTKARGGGLGLPIARRTAELHGGRLTLAPSTAGGTTAVMSLPLKPIPIASDGL